MALRHSWTPYPDALTPQDPRWAVLPPAPAQEVTPIVLPHDARATHVGNDIDGAIEGGVADGVGEGGAGADSELNGATATAADADRAGAAERVNTATTAGDSAAAEGSGSVAAVTGAAAADATDRVKTAAPAADAGASPAAAAARGVAAHESAPFEQAAAALRPIVGTEAALLALECCLVTTKATYAGRVQVTSHAVHFIGDLPDSNCSTGSPLSNSTFSGPTGTPGKLSGSALPHSTQGPGSLGPKSCRDWRT